MASVLSASEAAAISARLGSLVEEPGAKVYQSDTGALILRRDVSVMVQADQSYARTEYQAIKMFDRQSAADHGDVSVIFNSHYFDVTLDFARVRYSDGSVKEIANDNPSDRPYRTTG